MPAALNAEEEEIGRRGEESLVGRDVLGAPTRMTPDRRRTNRAKPRARSRGEAEGRAAKSFSRAGGPGDALVHLGGRMRKRKTRIRFTSGMACRRAPAKKLVADCCPKRAVQDKSVRSTRKTNPLPHDERDCDILPSSSSQIRLAENINAKQGYCHGRREGEGG